MEVSWEKQCAVLSDEMGVRADSVYVCVTLQRTKHTHLGARHSGVPSLPSAVTRMPWFPKAAADPTEVRAKRTALLTPADLALVLSGYQPNPSNPPATLRVCLHAAVTAFGYIGSGCP